MESLIFMLMEMIDLVKSEYKLRIKRLTISGGCNRNYLLCQMKADALGVPVDLIKDEETAVIGGAVLGASYFYSESVKEIVRKFVSITKTFLPRPFLQYRYDELFRKYREEKLESFEVAR